MGVERMVAIIFILGVGCLIAMAAMYAKAWVETVILIVAACLGFAMLRRHNLKDGMYFRLLWHRRNYEDSYPAFNLAKREGR
jgi:O-antigen/teichoic acid export membrane protein